MLTACFFLSRLRQFLAFQSLNAMGVDTCVQQTINDGKETACMETTAAAPTDRRRAGHILPFPKAGKGPIHIQRPAVFPSKGAADEF